jgi:hypothetical protein
MGLLLVVLLALAAGAPWRRLGPVAAFLLVDIVAAIGERAGAFLALGRAWRLRHREVPWGTRLRRPLWMLLPETSLAVMVGAILATVAAALGFPGVGFGVLLTFVAFAVWMALLERLGSPAALTFEPAGLRAHMAGASFLVPWTDIARVGRLGPEHMQMIMLHIRDARAVVDSAEPRDLRTKARVRRCLGDGRFALWPWTGGLDGPTLVRTIEGARRGQVGRTSSA